MTVAATVRSPVTPALRDIQAPVSERLAAVTGEIRRIVLADAPLVARIGAHVMRTQGKMLRPTLLLLSSDVEGKAESRAITLGAVVELVHLATLVHDDAIDHSVLRRGMATINAAFSHQVSVIAGDFLYARALAELVTLGDVEPIGVLARASADMTVGELRELGANSPLESSEAEYMALISAKTASLMSAACEMGAIAGAPEHRVALRTYGHALGMAFQIVDDLIDYIEDETTTGKPAGLDLRERKVTLPLLAALRTMSRGERREVELAFDGDDGPTDEQVEKVRAMVVESDGVEYARSRAAEYAERALDAVRGLGGSPVVTALRDAVGYVMERHA